MSQEKNRGSYSILTWGCQMNEDDSAQMALMLEDRKKTDRKDRRCVSRGPPASTPSAPSRLRSSAAPGQNTVRARFFLLGHNESLYAAAPLLRQARYRGSFAQSIFEEHIFFVVANGEVSTEVATW